MAPFAPLAQIFQAIRGRAVTLGWGLLALSGAHSNLQAQCPQFTGTTVLDGVAVTAAQPHWFQCIDGVNDNPQPFTFELTALPAAHTGVVVDWGDGQSEIIGNWDGSALPHTYTPSIWATYEIMVTTSFCTGGTSGFLVHELDNPSASLKYGDINGGCTPFEGLPKIDIDRGYSSTWSFDIAWGDGSGNTAYAMSQIQAGAPFGIDPFTSADGETIHRLSGFSHIYDNPTCGSGDCGHTLLLTYSNYCLRYAAQEDFSGEIAGPSTLEDGLSDAFLTWNLDVAAVNLSDAVLCWPEDQVQVANASCANCCSGGQGNNTATNGFQRRERWDLGGGSWGGGGSDPTLWTGWEASCESQLTHNISFPGTGEYTLTLLTENLCGVDSAEVQVRVVEPPTVNITAASEPLCPGTPFQFETVAWGYSPPAAPADFAFYFNWGDGASSPNIPMVGGMIPFEQLVGQSHPYAAEGNFSPSVTVYAIDAIACTATDAVSVDVLAAPTSDFTLPTDSCTSSLDVQAIDASTDAITWDWSLVNPPTDLGSESQPVSVQLNGVGTYWFELTTTSAAGCNHTASQSISLNAFPSASFSSLAACFGQTTPLDPSSSTTDVDFGGGIVGYDWTFPTGSTQGSDASSAEYPDPVFTSPGAYAVGLTVTTAGGCTDSVTGEVEVLDSPVVELSSTDTTACAPLTLALNASDTTGTLGSGALVWNFGHGVEQSLDADGTHTFPHNFTDDTVTYTVSVAAGLAGCGTAESITVDILPSPAVWINGGQICSGETFWFEADAFGVVPGTDWAWNVDPVYSNLLGTYGTAESQFPNWNYVFINPGTTVDTVNFTLEVSHPGGCTATESATLFVQPAMSVDLGDVLQLDGSHCTPYTLETAALPVLNPVWDFGDSNNEDLPGATAHTYFSPDTFMVVLEGQSFFGCWGSDSLDVVVHGSPEVGLVSAGAVCAPGTSVLTRTQGPSDWSVEDWNLSVDLGGTTPWNGVADTALVLDAGLHLATVTGVNGFGCEASASADVLVHAEVYAVFAMPESGCAPVNVDVNAEPSGSDDALSTWVLHSQLGADTTTGLVPGGPAWWTSGGADSATWLVEHWVEDATTGCNAFFSDSLVVIDQPQGALSVGGLSGCDVVAELTYSGTAENYMWITGDPFQPGSTQTPGPNLTHIYGNALGTGYWATATLTASTGGCMDYDELSFEVPAWVIAEMGLPTSVCSGDEINLDNLSLGVSNGGAAPLGTWTWTVDGTEMVAFEPSGVSLEAEGTSDEVAEFQLIAVHPETGCSDTAVGQVVVLGTPEPSFLINPNVIVAPVTGADLVDLSVAAAGSEAVWSASASGVVSSDGAGVAVNWDAEVWGEQSVTLELSNAGCANSVTETVLIIPLPPSIEIFGDTTGCTPLQGIFYSEVGGVADSVMWTFGQGAGGSSAGVEHVVYNNFGAALLQGYFAPGSYQVWAAAYGPGGVSVNGPLHIEALEQVNAGFSVFPLVCLEAGESAHFTPYIAYPNAQYSWDFGDGSTMETAGGAPVTHSFETAGSPIVQLRVDQGLCTDSTWLSLCVEDLIGGSVSMPTAFTPLAGGGSTSGGHIGQYDVRDNDLFAPVIRGDVLAYDFSVYNRWGEMIFHTSDPEIGWNGQYQGRLCKQDVYVWKVAAVFFDASSVEYAGDVTLIRR